MAKRLPVFRMLGNSSNLAADDLLLAAMEEAEAPHARHAAEVLLSRKKPGGLLGVIKKFHRLQPDVQHVFIANVDPFFSALRQSVHNEDKQTVHNAVSIITQSGNHRLAYLLATVLTHSARTVRDDASQGLRNLVDQYFVEEKKFCESVTDGDDPSFESTSERTKRLLDFREDGEYLVSALEHVVDNFDSHHRSDVLELCLWLADQMRGTLWGLATLSRSKVGRCMNEIFQGSNDKRLVPAFYRAMSYQQFRSPLARVLDQRRDSEFMTELCRHSWLLTVPAIRKGFGFVHRLIWFEGGAEPLLELDSELIVNGIRLISATGISVDRKIELFQEILLAAPQPARRAAIWAVTEIESQPATDLLRVVLDWQDSNLSPIAFIELMRRCPEGVPSLMVRNINSRSPSIRKAAMDHVSDTSFEKYWAGFDDLDAEVRLVAGRAMAKVVQDLPRRLRAKLVSSSIKDRLRGIKIIRMLNIHADMEEQLYRLANERDEVVRSAAVAALGELGGSTSERIASRAVGDSDSRVQANAVQALEDMGSPRVEEAAKASLDSDVHRVRANAVKVLLKMNVREAAEALMEMLNHSATGQRISALWVIEQLHLATLMERVQRLAEEDPDDDVRQRAERIRQKLQAHAAMAEVKP